MPSRFYFLSASLSFVSELAQERIFSIKAVFLDAVYNNLISFFLWGGVGVSPFNFRERDSDKDGKVNFKEFFHGLFDLVRNYDEESHDTSHHSEDSQESPARKLFAELDKDGDG